MKKSVLLSVCVIFLLLAGGLAGAQTAPTAAAQTALPAAGQTVAQNGAAQNPSILPQAAHSKDILCLAVSADETLALTGSDDKTVKLWHLGSGKLLRTVADNPYSVDWVSFIPGTESFIYYSDKEYIIRSIKTGQLIRSIPALASVSALSPDGTILAAGTRESVIRLIDVASGSVLKTLSGHSPMVWALSFSPDGQLLLSGGYDNMVKVWNVKTGALRNTFASHTDVIQSVAFSKDGKKAVSVGFDEIPRIWDVEKGTLIKKLAPAGHGLLSACFSSDASQVFCGTYLGGGFASSLSSVRFTGDGSRIMTAGIDGTFKFWNTAGARVVSNIIPPDKIGTKETILNFQGAELSSDGKEIWAWQPMGLETWDAEALKRIQYRFRSGYHSASFAPKAGIVIAGDISGRVEVIDVRTWTLVQSLRGFNENDWIYTTACSDDASILAAANHDVLVYDAGTSSPRLRLSRKVRTAVHSSAFSPDKSRLFVGYRDGSVIAWSTKDGSILWQKKAHTNDVTSLRCSPDGKTVYSGGRDTMMYSWKAATGSAVKTFTGHTAEVNTIDVSPDSSLIASGAGPGDGTLKVWNAAEGRELYTGLSNRYGQWLAWTQDGYWDGSPQCGELVAMVQGTDAWNIDQFAVKNNRTDKVLSSIGLSTESDIVQYHKMWERRLRRLNLTPEDLLNPAPAPQTSILSTDVRGKFIDISASLSGNGYDLSSWQIWVNDVPLFGAEGKPVKGKEQKVSHTVELHQGRNRIEVSCTNRQGTESLRSATYVTSTQPAVKNLWFLAFGVSDYIDSPAIPDLLYAAKDAFDLGNAFKSMEGKEYSRVQTRVLTDSSVTRRAIEESKKFLADAAVDDTVVLFISGHGVQVDKNGFMLGSGPVAPDAGGSGGGNSAVGGAAGQTAGSGSGTPGAGLEGRGLTVVPTSASSPSIDEYTYYYLTADTRVSDIKGTASEFSLIESLLQDIAPRQKLFLIDTCQSGEYDSTDRVSVAMTQGRGLPARAIPPKGITVLGTGSVTGTSTPSLLSLELTKRERWIFNDIVRRSGAIVFSGSRGGEYSYEANDRVSWKQGAFTYAILQALQTGQADTDKNNIVSTDELRDFVSREVPVLVKQLDQLCEQHPVVDRDNLTAQFGFPRR